MMKGMIATGPRCWQRHSSAQIAQTRHAVANDETVARQAGSFEPDEQ
jgi:hypothetical protein